MAGIGGVVVQFKADADKAIRETRKFVRSLEAVSKESESSGRKLGKMAKIGIGAVAAGAVGAAAGLLNMAKSAAEDDQSMRKLAKNIRNATKATDAQVESVEKWIAKQGMLLGVTDEKLRPAIARMVQSTKDATGAQRLTALAMDIAAGSGKDLQVVAQALARANDGNLNALKRLGVSLGDNALRAMEYQKAQRQLIVLQEKANAAMETYGPSSKQYLAAADRVKAKQSEMNGLSSDGIDWQKELAKQYKDAAKTQADSAQGALDRLAVIWDEMKETVGASVIDPITEFSEFMSTPQGQTWMEDLMTDVENVATSMAGLATDTGEFVGELKKIKDWYDSWPEWMKINAGKDKAKTNWNEPWNKMQEWKAAEKSEAAIAAPDASRPSGKSINPGNRTVNVTVVNGKQEKAVDSAAMAIRLAKTMER